MNVGELRRAIAAYLNPDYAVVTADHPAETDPMGKFQVGEIDLLLLALNNVKLEAEQARDFQLSKCDVDVAVDGFDGATLDTAVLHGSDIPISIKSILSPAGLRWDSGALTPVDVVPRDTYLSSLQMEEGRFGHVRYQGDPPSPNCESHGLTILTNGDQLRVVPSAAQTGTIYNIELSVYRWLEPYTKDSDCDFFTEFCHNYMMWAGIVEANHLVKQFVPRQEGNLPPPDKLKERAWAMVEKWDDFIEETGRVSRM